MHQAIKIPRKPCILFKANQVPEKVRHTKYTEHGISKESNVDRYFVG